MSRRLALLVAVFPLFCSQACSDCRVADLEVEFYNSTGKVIERRIEKLEKRNEATGAWEIVTPMEGPRGHFRLLRLGEYRVSWKGSQRDHVYNTAVVQVLRCRQKRSIVEGFNEPGGVADVGPPSITGKMKGCGSYRGWWVRVAPMFGEGAAFDGLVDRDGGFSLPYAPAVRCVVVYGYEGNAVGIRNLNVEAGRANDVGVIDVSEACKSR